MDLNSLPRYPGGPLQWNAPGVHLIDCKVGPQRVDCDDWFCNGAELFRIHEWAHWDVAMPIALCDALNAAYQDNGEFSLEVPLEFGPRWAGSLTQVRSELAARHGQNLPDLATVALRNVTYERQVAAITGFLTARESQGSPYSCAPSYQLPPRESSQVFPGLKPYDLRKGTAFEASPASDSEEELTEFDDVPTEFEDARFRADLHKVMALIWFFEAAELHRSGIQEGLDLLFEVAECLRHADGEELSVDTKREVKGTQARKAASARHQESRDTAARIRAWWRDNRGQFSSMNAAAEKAAIVFGCAFTTAREHIKRARKELQSAG